MSRAARDAAPTATSCGACFDGERCLEVVVGGWPQPRAGAWLVCVELEPGACADAPPEAAVLRLADWVALDPRASGAVPVEALALWEHYGACALMPLLARRLGRAVTVNHFAQSLDGRIAAPGGDSRWIGDMDNRVHAHRMRALCDGILIGAGTLRQDAPSLNVRHVEGEDPVRVVLGAEPDEVGCLLEASAAPIWLVGAQDDRARDGVELLEAPGSLEALLAALLARGVFSVYIEGGSATTSSFLAEGALDLVQLHLAPMILGAGQVGFQLPGIDGIGAAVRFSRHRFVPVGEGVMFVGRVAGRGGDDG